jgi:hypothetical protein
MEALRKSPVLELAIDVMPEKLVRRRLPNFPVFFSGLPVFLSVDFWDPGRVVGGLGNRSNRELMGIDDRLRVSSI